jgi:hypothetical protein
MSWIWRWEYDDFDGQRKAQKEYNEAIEYMKTALAVPANTRVVNAK